MKRLGKYPAVVTEYQQNPRRVRVSIPGITDGAEQMPIAEMEYPLGDRSEYTEVEILVGSRVWVMFEAGDERYPIITGYRTKNVGNEESNDWRRWHHENIELVAELQIHLQCDTAIIDAKTSATINTTDAVVNASGSAEITAGESASVTAPDIQLNGDTTVNGNLTVTEDAVIGGISFLDHPHTSTAPGTPTSPPLPT